MKMRCFGCGVPKDTDVEELCTVPEAGFVMDEPIPPLFVLDVEPRDGSKAWRRVVVCHACLVAVDADMWISSDCWASIQPMVPFTSLPLLPKEEGSRVGDPNPALYASYSPTEPTEG